MSFTLTEAEYNALYERRIEAENNEQIRYTNSEFIRDHIIMPYLNGSETRKEDPPPSKSSEPTSEPVSEPTSKNPFSFDEL